MRLLSADVPANLPKYVRGVALTDVPVHRASVGGMACAAGSQMPHTDKPYVYRGKGFDQYETMVLALAPPKPPKRKRRRRRREPDLGRLWDTRRRVHNQPALPPAPYAPATYTPEPVKYKLHMTRPSVKHPRPATGWKPVSGADLDALLEELDA